MKPEKCVNCGYVLKLHCETHANPCCPGHCVGPQQAKRGQTKRERVA